MDDFRPSVFTPFLRRFTDEKARDIDDTRALYRRVLELHRRSKISMDGQRYVTGRVYESCYEMLPQEVQSPVLDTVWALLSLEHPIFECPEIDLATARLSLKESVDLRHFLRAKEHFHAHEDKVVGLLIGCLTRIFQTIAEALPQTEAPSPFSIPLIYTLPDPTDFIDNLFGELWKQEYVDNGLFVEVSRTLYFNLCRISGIADPKNPKKPFKLSKDSDASLQEIVETYLAGTPFKDFFLAPVPLKFSHEDRFSHMHVVGGSGAGKTQLLQSLIVHDLQTDDPPALVVVDSQGDLINKLSHLDLFRPERGRLHDRLTIVTPKDIRTPPALNIFDVKPDRLSAYDEAAKEQVVAGVIQTFDYLFTGLLGADLTAKQGVFFRFVARLMLALPETLGRNATILDMMALMDDVGPYNPAIASLPPIQRQFFERDFASKGFAQTREQIRYRLNAILENPTLARLFTAEETRIDLFKELNNGGIILVDTAKDFLKGASSHFGRIFISLVLQAVLERAVTPESERRPAFLIVDEAANYFDSNIDDLLTEARKYKLGCVFAHQFLDQCTSQLRSSLAANTSLKFASGVSMADARAMAPDMRTTADFVLSQRRLHFAAHIRHVTPGAVSIPVSSGALERLPQMPDGDYRSLHRSNSEKVGVRLIERLTVPSGAAASHDHDLNRTARSPAPEKSDPVAASDEW